MDKTNLKAAHDKKCELHFEFIFVPFECLRCASTSSQNDWAKTKESNAHMSNGLNLLHPRKDVAEMVIVFCVSPIVPEGLVFMDMK